MAEHTGCVTSVDALSVKQPDFTIIGGGIGGLVVANRLSECADKNVLLIEARANRLGDPRIDIVGMLSTLYGDSDHDWGFMTDPQMHVKGRHIPHPRGKMLGGSTGLNFCANVYPSVNGSIVATCVRVQTNDDARHEIMAKKQVVLSGGAIQSPQNLELSGIGQKGLLEKHGIPLVLDTPGVGENLQDHAISALCFEIADEQVSADIMRDPNIVHAALQEYISTKTGPLVCMPIIVTILPLVNPSGRVSKEDIIQLTKQYQERQYEQFQKQILGPNEAAGYAMMLPLQLNMTSGKTEMKEVFAPTSPKNSITIMAVNNHPFSRGICHIMSANPKDKPILDLRYLSHPLDLEVLALQTQCIETIVKTEPFASLLKPSGRLPGGKEATSLDEAKKIIKEQLFSTFHPTGTYAMMTEEIEGVVDTRLRVYRTKNLRVVDASIFPMETLGNIQATIYAVAERAADLIKEDWKRDV